MTPTNPSAATDGFRKSSTPVLRAAAVASRERLKGQSMQETTPSQAGEPGTHQNYRGWQSDIIVDLIKRYGFPAITLNPGASFRGLHDSLINYGGNEPPMMLCQHEEIAV